MPKFGANTENMNDLLGQAILDYALEQEKGPVYIHNHYGDPDEMPVDVFFRIEEDFFDVETKALAQCRGKVLDVGAGAGCHSLNLQNKGLQVDALEISELASRAMFMQGVASIITGNIYDYKPTTLYDTILLMMNTIGLAGSIDNLLPLFKKLASLLAPGGQILFDSSDISYLYEGNRPTDKYFGEQAYCYEYNGQKGSWFKWLYVDFETAKAHAAHAGIDLRLEYTNPETDQYLAKGLLGAS